MASEAAPIVDYLDQREDSDLEYIETIHAQVVDRNVWVKRLLSLLTLDMWVWDLLS